MTTLMGEAVISRTYVDVHVLQTVPPSNLNRDDAGSPKQAMYGGARRARVSSQAWKRAARTAFAEQIPREQLATRTKKIAALLSTRLSRRCEIDAETSARIATHMLVPLGIKAGKRAGDTAYLLFFGRTQMERLVELVADQVDDLAGLEDDELAEALKDLPIQETLGTGHPMDVALFGRMVADIPGLNVDAATQVAHALSTHPVEIEFDYYTAVDDENLKEETGAAMIGTVEFDSATLYRFATVGLHQLLENLGGDIEDTLRALEVFLTAFVRSMPTGHENSFAHRTAPFLVSVALRSDQPVNLVSAYETPVRANRGVAGLSAIRLAEEMRRVTELWGLVPLQVLSTYAAPPDEGEASAMTQVMGSPQPFAQVIAGVVAASRERLVEEAQ
jgi:CRISPR system Cascade subunit CasC